VIVFVPGILGPVFRVSAAGGTPVPLTRLAGEERAHRYPWFLPDGRHFLYTAVSLDWGRTGKIYVGDLESANPREIGEARSNVAYAAPGYLLFVRAASLMAQPFSLSRLETTGDPVPVAEHVSYGHLDLRALFASSQTGMVAYVPVDAGGTSQLTWVDRSGKQVGVVGVPVRVIQPTISPDGNSVAAAVHDPQTGLSHIWMYDLKRGTASPFTLNTGYNSYPVWSPDGSRLAFTSNPGGPTYIYQKAVAGGADEALESNPVPRASTDWSRDGRYTEYVLAKTIEIWVLPLFGERKAFPYLQGDFNALDGKLSLNGRWLAYDADESKRREVYVQIFPTPAGKWRVSTNGGRFSHGAPKALFDAGLVPGTVYYDVYDVARDGRFLLLRPVEQGGSTPLEVIVNCPRR
jgi:dipeptidyl aminopeptidase/acylaminoacyl peptidase